MKIILLDRSISMVGYWVQAFKDTDVECICDDFASFMRQRGNEIDCVVSPANSYGLMDGGYDLAISNWFGEKLPQKVQKYIQAHYHGEQPVGTSFLIQIPDSEKYLAHTPTMRIPSPIYDWMTVYHAMRSTLLEALRYPVNTILVPAFGGRCGEVPKGILARMMRLAYDQVLSDIPKELTWKYALRDMESEEMPEQLRPVFSESSDESVNP